VLHLLVPVGPTAEASAPEIVQELLGKGWWAFGPRTQGRRHLRRGDRLCFYLKATGVVARARLAGDLAERRAPASYDKRRYTWVAPVTDVAYFFANPVTIDRELRSKLDAFKGKDPAASGAWFVQSAHMVTGHDYALLTRQA
jgi:hypothetical protein